ncbi:T9SS type A sorting domain-containing protein [candidate division KSB1 bacterium]|nr:T9SS type A sorting domain-containing protein [candidate division KSB1 bacterium]
MKRTAHYLMPLLLIAGLFTTAQGGTLEAFTLSGIFDIDNSTFLQGDVFTGRGDLIQLIWVGPNGQIDPADSLGQTTSDDSLLGTTYIGYGFPFEPNAGKFSKIFTHDLLVSGAIVFVRAWNDSVVAPASPVAYGNSQPYTMVNDFDSHDFQSWSTGEMMNVPVELASFTASSRPGFIELNWTTHSETDNLGFYLFRSDAPNGTRVKLNDRIIQGAITSQVRHDYRYEDRDVEEQIVYYYWLADIDVKGQMTLHGPATAVGMVKPDNYMLAQNYPNPFNPSTSITYTLKEGGKIKLWIYNIRGQLIRELVNTQQQAGAYSLEWDGRDQNGFIVPSGVYFYTLEANDFKATRTMTMAK